MNANSSALKRGIVFLSSTKLFWWFSIVIFILFYAAMFMCKNGVDDGAFFALNNQLLIDWMMQPAASHPTVATWFYMIFFCFIVVALNMLSRLILEVEQLVALAKRSISSGSGASTLFFLRKLSVFLVHLFFILMLSVYGISSVTGLKFQGEALRKGAPLQHADLPFAIECIDIRKAAQQEQTPWVILKRADADTGETFTIPGWHDGIYYGVNRINLASDDGDGETQEAGATPRTELRLFVHQFSRGYFVTAMILWLSSLIFFIALRPESAKLFKKPMGR